MIKVNYISAVILLAAASVAHAETTTTTTTTKTLPGDQGIASVNKNLERDPENKGLKNASEQLERNRLKHEEQAKRREERREQNMEKRSERQEKRAERQERHERHERHEGAGRPAKMERPGK